MTNQLNDERRPKTSNFGGTDLRKRVSEANFDVEVDFAAAATPKKVGKVSARRKNGALTIRT